MSQKNKICLVILCIFWCNSALCQYQWPFPNPSLQTTVTGSVGEYRFTASTGEHRFHQGVDLTNGGNLEIRAINSGVVAWNKSSLASRSSISVRSNDGTTIRYIHVVPTDAIKDGRVNTVVTGDIVGKMIVESGWPTHLHLEEETTNFLDHNLQPYIDNSAPYFSSTTIHGGVAFYENGLLKTNANYSDILLDSQVNLNAQEHTVLYEKVDIVAHAIDPRVNPNGSNGGGQMVPSEISWKLRDYRDTTQLSDELRFDGIPNNAAAIYAFHPLSHHAGSPSIHILTSHPRQTPYDRFMNTRLRRGQTETWIISNRPLILDARLNEEAKYPDGKYSIRFNASDVDFADDPNLSANPIIRPIVIDNFRPYVKEVIVKRNGQFGTILYRGHWEWNESISKLVLKKAPINDANPADNLWIKITTSEPVQNLKTNIPSVDYNVYRSNIHAVPNSNNTEFVLVYTPITSSGIQTLNIKAEDYAGNQLQTNPAIISIHQADGTWLPLPVKGVDGNHKFKTGTNYCSGFSGGRKANSTYASQTLSSECLYADVSADRTIAQQNEAIVLTPITSGNGQITYEWNFGAGAIPATSATSGPQTVIYTTSGAKTVTLKICDNTSQCITQTKTGIITVGQPESILSVDFSTDRNGAATNQDIQLTSIVTGAVGAVSYSWDFGDVVIKGHFSDVNPKIAYSMPGYKTVRLTVTDANGSVTKVRNNYLTINSLAFDIKVNISGCGQTSASGDIILAPFNVSGGNGHPYDSYFWDFGDGTTQLTTSSSSITHNYKTAGKFTVRLTVCDETGCGTFVSTDCITRNSNTLPSTLAFNFNVNGVNPVGNFMQQVSLNTPVKFTSAVTGGDGDPNTFYYNWDFESHYVDGGSMESAVPSVSYIRGPFAREVYYTTPGQKEVTLVVIDDRTSKRQTIPALEVVKGLGSGTCYATIGDISLSSTCWSADNKPKFTVPITSSNCPVAKIEVTLFGKVLPNGVIDFKNFAPETVPKFPITTDAFGFEVYQYDGVKYNLIGSKWRKFTIYGPVTADAGPDKQVCLGSSTSIGSEPSSDRIYQWSSTNAPLSYLSNLTSANPTFSGVQKGTYIYKLTVTDKIGGCSKSDEVTIIVDRPEVTPISGFAPLSIPLALSMPATGGFGNVAYRWSPETNLSSAATANPTFTSTTEGDFNYLVTVTDAIGCQSSAQAYVNAASRPANLMATAESFTRISLRWIDRSPNETGFVIQRSVDGGSFVNYASVGSNVQTFEDLNISKGVLYTYKVAAKIAGVNSGFTNEASVNTANLPQFSEIDPGAGSLTYADFDNDGDIDYARVSYQRPNMSIQIFENAQGTYALKQSFATPQFVFHWCKLLVGDYDNDNDLDVYLNPWYGAVSKPALLINQNFTFVVVNTNVRVMSFPRVGTFDYDGDNSVDFMATNHISNYNEANVEVDEFPTYHVYKNIGNNSFADVDLNIPIEIDHATMHSILNAGLPFGLGDFDNDGDDDMIATTRESKRLYLFKNTQGISLSNKIEILSSCCITNGTIDVGDVDMDKKLDFANTTGSSVADFSNLMRNNGNSFLKDVSVKLSQAPGSIKLADYDNDNDLDFFISSNGSAQVFQNDFGNFSSQSSLGSDLETWVDYDGDGDLDILGAVRNDQFHSNQIGTGGKIYRNNEGTNKITNNTPPSRPTNLCVYFNHDEATFTWDPSTDAQTSSAGLTYNLYVRQNGKFILSPLADVNTGFRKVLKRGNVDQNTSWTVTIPNSGDFEWGVQAIDNCYVGSVFAKSIMKPTLELCGPVTASKTVSSKDIVTPQNCSPLTTTVSNGASLTLEASNMIRLLPGFSVRPGSYLNGRLIRYTNENSPCADIGRDEQLNSDSQSMSNEDDIVLYPNPSTGQFNVRAKFQRMQDQLWLEVIDISGVIVERKKYDQVQTIIDALDLSSVAQGIYIIRIILYSGKTINRKIVKL